MACAATNSNTEEEEVQPSFMENTTKAWFGGRGMIVKDLPRLARRTKIMTNGINVFNGDEHKAWDSCLTLIQMLIQEFEPSRLEELAPLFEEFGGEPPKEPQSRLAQLIDKLDYNNQVCATLAACSQTLVYQPSFEITTRLFDSNLLKDVRTAEGWQLEIRCRPETVQVVHRKQQQNLVPEDSPDHLVVTWELLMTFTRDMVNMTDCALKLTKVEYNENMNPDARKAWEQKLVGGNVRIL